MPSMSNPIDNNHPILQSLNDEQCAAVSAPDAHRLILAGAGSGKTRVLVHRIAWLMAEHHVSPFGILAVTFTNKAAHEMRSRIEMLRGIPLRGMWVGTFHGLAHRLLRAHFEAAELPESFQIMDSDDQLRMIKRIMRDLTIDDTKWPPRQIQWFINHCKEEGKRPQHLTTDSGYHEDIMQQVYLAYETICRRSGLVDFSELLLRSLELLQQHPDIAHHYQQRFAHILVDEFQDTNTIQYLWLQALAGPQTILMAVGDDDQSIYSWRGAKIENIHRFSRDYPTCETIRLEQNYRSTQTILKAANTVIENNQGRLGKELWTQGDRGEAISLYSAFSEQDEAYYIVATIKELCSHGFQYSEIAMLYRSNAQSRVLEERLLEAKIPYRIYGGQKFFERAEVKDALGYLRLIANRQDDAAFERIVNTPTRGIGNTTLIKIRQGAKENATSLWETAQYFIEQGLLTGRASSAMQQFIDLIDTLEASTCDSSLSEQVDAVLDRSTLLAHYQKDRSEKGLSRVENLSELITATEQFTVGDDQESLTPLAAFLSHVALETGETQSEEHSDCVSLMTLHAAKGLEFPVVFMTGLEEGLFPHKMATDEAKGLEEERRLCYVGMTRAMKRLFITHAETRRMHGTEQYNRPSRFITEMPQDLISNVRTKTQVARPHAYQRQAGAMHHRVQNRLQANVSSGVPGLNLGDRVMHEKFGQGTIINYEGSGDHARIQVQFDDYGSKWLVASFAKLSVI